jgi:hypothetical protein
VTKLKEQLPRTQKGQTCILFRIATGGTRPTQVSKLPKQLYSTAYSTTSTEPVSSCPHTSQASTRMHNMHMPTARRLVGSVAMISARPGPTLTVVVAVEVAAQANNVVAPPGVNVVGVAEPMVVHVHILIMSTSPTPTATLQPRNGKSSVQCLVYYCKCTKVAAVVAAEVMTINRLPTAPHNALLAWSR